MTGSDSRAGSAIYFSFVLRFVYDFLVLRLYCSYVWRCPVYKIQGLYSRHLDRWATYQDKPRPLRLLDIGVGTGYHVKKAPLPFGCEVFLADLNSNCLETAETRVKRAHPSAKVSTLKADFLASDSENELALTPARLDGAQFDIISCMLLLHCLPGPPRRKADSVVRLQPLLSPQGVVLGSTVLGDHADHSLLGRLVMWWHNRMRVFENKLDDAHFFVEALEARFEEVEWEIVGAVLLFAARGAKIGRT